MKASRDGASLPDAPAAKLIHRPADLSHRRYGMEPDNGSLPEFWSGYTLTQENRIEKLVFGSSEIWRKYRASHGNVLLVDLSSGRNDSREIQYCVSFVGKDSADNTVHLAFALMRNNSSEDFTWLFDMVKLQYENYAVPLPERIYSSEMKTCYETVEKEFPSSHMGLWLKEINRDFVAQCRRQVVQDSNRKLHEGMKEEELTPDELKWIRIMSDWIDILESDCRKDFKARWKEFRATYKKKHPDVYSYLQNQWIIPHRRILTGLWTMKESEMKFDQNAYMKGAEDFLAEAVARETLEESVEAIITAYRQRQEDHPWRGDVYQQRKEFEADNCVDTRVIQLLQKPPVMKPKVNSRGELCLFVEGLGYLTEQGARKIRRERGLEEVLTEETVTRELTCAAGEQVPVTEWDLSPADKWKYVNLGLRIRTTSDESEEKEREKKAREEKEREEKAREEKAREEKEREKKEREEKEREEKEREEKAREEKAREEKAREEKAREEKEREEKKREEKEREEKEREEKAREEKEREEKAREEKEREEKEREEKEREENHQMVIGGSTPKRKVGMPSKYHVSKPRANPTRTSSAKTASGNLQFHQGVLLEATRTRTRQSTKDALTKKESTPKTELEATPKVTRTRSTSKSTPTATTSTRSASKSTPTTRTRSASKVEPEDMPRATRKRSASKVELEDTPKATTRTKSASKAEPEDTPKATRKRSASMSTPKATTRSASKTATKSAPEVTPKAARTRSASKVELEVTPKATTRTRSASKSTPTTTTTRSASKSTPTSTTTRSASKTATKSAPEVTPKAARTRSASMSIPKATTRSASKTTLEDTPRARTRSASMSTTRPALKTASKTTLEDTPKARTRSASMSTTRPASKIASKTASKATPEATPKATRRVSAKGTPTQTPSRSTLSNGTSKSTPKSAASVSSLANGTHKSASATPKTPAKATPKSTSKTTPRSVTRATPKSVTKPTPKSTSKSAASVLSLTNGTSKSASDTIPKTPAKATPKSASKTTPRTATRATPKSVTKPTPKSAVAMLASKGSPQSTTQPGTPSSRKRSNEETGSASSRKTKKRKSDVQNGSLDSDTPTSKKRLSLGQKLLNFLPFGGNP